MYSAQKWFDKFYNRFVQTRREDRGFGVKVTSGKYTRLMMDWLEDLGEYLEFKVKRERLTIDQFWEHESKGIIALEHEISARGIFKKELRNLMDISSDLKVLITYVYDHQFPWETENISDRIENEMNMKYTRKKYDELLLIIGTKTTRRFQGDKRIFMERESDWYARSFSPRTVRKEIMVPSASRKARKAWRTRQSNH